MYGQNLGQPIALKGSFKFKAFNAAGRGSSTFSMEHKQPNK